MLDEIGLLQQHLKDHDVELRDIRRRIEAVTVGDSVRADAIDGIIPAANAPVNWFYNGNLLGAGTKADWVQHSGVWISGVWLAGRAYYHVGTYGAQGISGVDWNCNDQLVGWGRSVDFHQNGYLWISGTFVGGEATYNMGLLPLPFISGVSFGLNGAPLCWGAGLDLQEETGIWISGSCAAGQARYKVGAYPGGGGGSGTVAWYVGDDHFCDALEAELAAGAGIWISGTCEGGNHAKFEIGVIGAGGTFTQRVLFPKEAMHNIAATSTQLGATPDQIATFQCAPAATGGCQVDWTVPGDWDSGAVTVILHYCKGAAGAGSIVHQLNYSLINVGDNVIEAGTTSPQTVAVPGDPAQTRAIITWAAAFTPAVAGEFWRLNYRRLGGDGADDFGGVSHVLAIEIQYTATR